MAEQTNDLKLFKYNTATDGKEVFSIERSMNENWDKIDAFSSAIKSLSNLDAVGEKRFTDINTELSKKLEAEVLLAENGYIKFNNGFLIQYGSLGMKSSGTVTFPITMSNTQFCWLASIQAGDTFPKSINAYNPTVSNIAFRCATDGGGATANAYRFCIIGF